MWKVCDIFNRFYQDQEATGILGVKLTRNGCLGRRRKIPYLWAYSFISQILPVSFAQNLFYLAIFMAPIPTHDETVWTPAPVVQLAPLVAYYALIFFAPYAAGTNALISVVIAIRLLLFCPLLLPNVIPQYLGKKQITAQKVYQEYSGAFRIIGVCSALLFAFQTTVALQDYNLKFWKIAAAITDSPAVSALGYDYVLSLASFALWVVMVR